VVYINMNDTVGWYYPLGRFYGNFIALSDWNNIIYLYCMWCESRIILSKCAVWGQRQYCCTTMTKFRLCSDDKLAGLINIKHYPIQIKTLLQKKIHAL